MQLHSNWCIVNVRSQSGVYHTHYHTQYTQYHKQYTQYCQAFSWDRWPPCNYKGTWCIVIVRGHSAGVSYTVYSQVHRVYYTLYSIVYSQVFAPRPVYWQGLTTSITQCPLHLSPAWLVSTCQCSSLQLLTQIWNDPGVEKWIIPKWTQIEQVGNWRHNNKRTRI